MLRPELTTVADDAVVVHEGPAVHRRTGLEPGTTVEVGGLSATTLVRPPGEHLCTFVTVNDLHFGEEEVVTEHKAVELGVRMRRPDGETPHPVLCNAAAIAEILPLNPAAVVAKGDLTTHGSQAEYSQFLDHYGTAFGDRLHHVRGNHECHGGQQLADRAPCAVTLPGVTLAVLDTTLFGEDGGVLSTDSLEWLDTLGVDSDQPVLVFGHHHCWNPDARTRPDDYFGINPADSEALIDVVRRRPRLRGYFAGHTHRNRVRRFPWLTGDVPFAEISCVKDYPGVWAEYRVFEGGILQIVHRISDPEVLKWTDLTRDLLPDRGYERYAFGSIDDRCFPISV